MDREIHVLLAPGAGPVAEAVHEHCDRLGYRVVEAEDARTVLDEVQRPGIDLIVLSTELDEAFELCGDLRGMAETRHMPLVLVSPTLAAPPLVASGLLAGADDFACAAPSHLAELGARLRVQLRHKRYRDTLGRMRAERNVLRTSASTDALTGLPNRRSFEHALQQAFDSGKPISVLFVDVDHFKSVNDRYGHTIGDQVLRRIGGALGAATRATDTCARYGGEEFVIVLVGADREVARRVGERHRTLLERIPAAELGGPDKITVSVGVADHDPTWEDDSALALLKRADAALYRAKANGRNRIEVSEREASDEEAHLPMPPLSPIFSHLPRGAG